MLASSRQYRNHTLAAGEGSDRPAPSNVATPLLLFCGFLAPTIFVAAFVLQGWLQPGYDALRDYVSDLSLGSGGWVQVASFIICGWLLLGFSLGLCAIDESGRISPWLPAVFGLMGFGFIAAGAFQIDPTWARLTLHGQLHYAASFLIGGSMMLAGFIAWQDLRAQGRRKGANACLVTGLTCMGLFSASLILPQADLPGLVERIALLVGAVWIAGFALGLLRTGAGKGVYAHQQLGKPGVARHELNPQRAEGDNPLDESVLQGVSSGALREVTSSFA